jgi:hypothetical protein
LRDAHLPVQRRLVAHGSDADITRLFAIAGPASGVTLSRDPVTHVVTAIASSAAGPTSPAFAGVLTAIINNPAQNAEAQFGTHQAAPLPGGGVAGVFVGAFPPAAPTVQVIDLDDLEAVETGADTLCSPLRCSTGSPPSVAVRPGSWLPTSRRRTGRATAGSSSLSCVRRVGSRSETGP